MAQNSGALLSAAQKTVAAPKQEAREEVSPPDQDTAAQAEKEKAEAEKSRRFEYYRIG